MMRSVYLIFLFKKKKKGVRAHDVTLLVSLLFQYRRVPKKSTKYYCYSCYHTQHSAKNTPSEYSLPSRIDIPLFLSHSLPMCVHVRRRSLHTYCCIYAFCFFVLFQEYGAHVPLALLDADDTTLRSLVPVVKAGGAAPTAAGPANPGGSASASMGGAAAEGAATGGAVSSETMIRESPGK